MTLCTEACLVNVGAEYKKAITLFCNSWSCEICAPRRQKRLVAEICDGLPERLLTLTCRPGTAATPALQARMMADAWRILISWIREIWHEVDHQYFVVFEAHKSGWPHMHIALRGHYMPHWWLSAAWEALTGSPGVDIRMIYNPKQCAHYVAKYMGKDSHRFGTCKRYWKSTRWCVIPYDEGEPDDRFSNRWVVVPERWADLLEGWYWRYKHVWLEGDAAVTGPDPPWAQAELRRIVSEF